MAEQEGYISESDFLFISNMLDEAMRDETYTQTQISWDILKQSAINFLQAYKKIEVLENNQINKQMDALLAFNGFASNSINRSSFLIKKNKLQFLKMKYLLAFNFDAKLTAFRGQLPKEAVYVVWDSQTKTTKSYKMPMNKLIELADEDGRLFLKSGDLKGEEISQLEKEDKEGLDEKHIIEAQSAYRGVASRLTQFYNKTGVEWWHRKNGLLMWKLNKAWTIARVTSYGDVKEAYVAALMTKHQQNVDKLYGLGPGQPIYYDDLLIASFFNNYINNVTNMAAIVEEDVNLAGNTAQYAVKSKGASLPSLNQYVVTAEKIALRTTPFDKHSQDLENYIRNELFPMDAKRNIILGTFNNLGEMAVSDALSPLQQRALFDIRKH